MGALFPCQITDIEPAIFKLVLQALYTDQVTNLAVKQVAPALSAAKKYQVPASRFRRVPFSGSADLRGVVQVDALSEACVNYISGGRECCVSCFGRSRSIAVMC